VTNRDTKEPQVTTTRHLLFSEKTRNGRRYLDHWLESIVTSFIKIFTVYIVAGFNGSTTDGKKNNSIMTNSSYHRNGSAVSPSPFATLSINIGENESDIETADGKKYGYGGDVTEPPEMDTLNGNGSESVVAGALEYAYDKESTAQPEVGAVNRTGNNVTENLQDRQLETRESDRTFTENVEFRTSDHVITPEPETVSNPMQNMDATGNNRVSTLIPKLFTRTKIEPGKRTYGDNAGTTDGIYSDQATTDIPVPRGQHMAMTSTERLSSADMAESEDDDAWELVPTENAAFDRQESSSSASVDSIVPTAIGDFTDH
jgi:hypothetical protein